MQQERPWLTEQIAEACAVLLKSQQECRNVFRDALVSTAARLPPPCPCVRGGEDRADSLIQVVRNYAERPSFAEFCVCMAEGEEQWPHWGFILCSCYLLTGAKISLRFCSKASKRTVNERNPCKGVTCTKEKQQLAGFIFTTQTSNIK